MHGDTANPAGAPSALKLEIDGNAGDVSFDASGGTVQGASGNVQVSTAEAEAARERPWQLVGALRSAGLQTASSAGDDADEAYLADTQEAMLKTLGGMPLAVVLDTTTYQNARQALAGDTRAHTLLDLNLLAVAAVFFEYVIIQPDLIEPADEEAEFTRVMRPSLAEDRQLDDFHMIAVAESERSRRDLQGAWRTFLRDPAVELDLDNAPLSAEDDTYYEWSFQDLPSNRDQINEYVTQQTVRAIYNDRVAGALQLPYLASSVRLPVAAELIRSHGELLVMLRRALGPQGLDAAAEATPFAAPEPMYAPLMLGVLLDRAVKAGGRDAVMDCLVGLRNEMADFREFLTLHQQRLDWHERPQDLLAEVSGRLNADLVGSGIAKAQKASMQATEGAAGLAFGPVATLAVRVLKALLPEDTAAKAVRRMFHRELFLLTDVTQEAARIATLDAQVKKVWGKSMDSNTRKTLDRIAHLNADPLLRIGRV